MTVADYLTANLRTPFEWGKFDCITFAARWVREATGVDHLAGIAAWSSATEGVRRLQELGGIEKLLDERFERINPHLALDGDLGLYQGAVQIFSGTQLAGAGKTGLIFTCRMQAERAWRLPASRP
jgi:hypothetical protein